MSLHELNPQGQNTQPTCKLSLLSDLQTYTKPTGRIIF